MIELFGYGKLKSISNTSKDEDDEWCWRDIIMSSIVFILYLFIMVYAVNKAMKYTITKDACDRMIQIFLAVLSPFIYILASLVLIKD